MRLIKRYPNRKLYDTQGKEYVTLKVIADLIRDGNEVKVIDHASGEDLTALTLTQIILEEERKQSGLLSHSTLMALIRAGGDRLSALQRSFLSPGLWQQIDEEIRSRIQALVRQGELTIGEGEALVGKLIQEGRRRQKENMDRADQAFMSVKDLENYLKTYPLPTQDDLDRINAQLEELSSRLDEIDFRD